MYRWNKGLRVKGVGEHFKHFSSMDIRSYLLQRITGCSHRIYTGNERSYSHANEFVRVRGSFELVKFASSCNVRVHVSSHVNCIHVLKVYRSGLTRTGVCEQMCGAHVFSGNPLHCVLPIRRLFGRLDVFYGLAPSPWLFLSSRYLHF